MWGESCSKAKDNGIIVPLMVDWEKERFVQNQWDSHKCVGEESNLKWGCWKMVSTREGGILRWGRDSTSQPREWLPDISPLTPLTLLLMIPSLDTPLYFAFAIRFSSALSGATATLNSIVSSHSKKLFPGHHCIPFAKEKLVFRLLFLICSFHCDLAFAIQTLFLPPPFSLYLSFSSPFSVSIFLTLPLSLYLSYSPPFSLSFFLSPRLPLSCFISLLLFLDPSHSIFFLSWPLEFAERFCEKSTKRGRRSRYPCD